MTSIAEKQDRIGWANFTNWKITRRIRDMQTMYMCNRGTTYAEDHWTRDFIKYLMCLTYKQCLGQNLMKHHRTEGAITSKTRG